METQCLSNAWGFALLKAQSSFRNLQMQLPCLRQACPYACKQAEELETSCLLPVRGLLHALFVLSLSILFWGLLA